jgi:hypothetical protein
VGWHLFFVRPPGQPPNSPQRQLHQQSDILYFQKANGFEIKVKRAMSELQPLARGDRTRRAFFDRELRDTFNYLGMNERESLG